MHITALIFTAVKTCVGTGGSFGIAAIQFYWSFISQIKHIFKVIRDNPDRQKTAAAATIAIPLALLWCYVLITGMGMDYFLMHTHEAYVIQSLEHILDSSFFVIELVVVGVIFLHNTYIYIPLSKINKIEIIISFAIPMITICISISIYICKFITGAPSFFEDLLRLNQLYLRLYVYGISSLFLTTINTTLGLFVYMIVEGRFPNKNSISKKDLTFFNKQGLDYKEAKAYLVNQKKVKEYILGYTKYYLVGVISVWIGTLILGIYIFKGGEQDAGLFLMLCSCVYIPWIFKLIKTQFLSGKYTMLHLLKDTEEPHIWFAYFCKEIIDNPPKAKLNDKNEEVLITKHFVLTRNKLNQKLDLVEEYAVNEFYL